MPTSRRVLAPSPQPFVGGSGRRFDWSDASSHLRRLINRRFPRVDEWIQEDALQSALLNLLEYWQSVPSAYDAENAGLKFEFALARGMDVASTYIQTELDHNRIEVSYTFGSGPSDHDRYDEDDTNLHAAYIDFPDPSPGPEELAIEADEQERARRLLATMSAEDLETCFTLLEAGSTRELADRLGVDHSTVVRRQERARKFVRAAARKVGFDVPEPRLTNTAGRTVGEQAALDQQMADHRERRAADLAWMKGGAPIGIPDVLPSAGVPPRAYVSDIDLPDDTIEVLADPRKYGGLDTV